MPLRQWLAISVAPRLSRLCPGRGASLVQSASAAVRPQRASSARAAGHTPLSSASAGGGERRRRSRPPPRVRVVGDFCEPLGGGSDPRDGAGGFSPHKPPKTKSPLPTSIPHL